MKKIVSYLRISSASQIDNTSIETQNEKIELYCKLNNIEIVKTYIDVSYTHLDVYKRQSYSLSSQILAISIILA